METIADKVIAFNSHLDFDDMVMPNGINVLNPFKDNPEARRVSELFYKKFYDDIHERKLILGINPGRFGAGTTGIPFTDPKRLIDNCKIPYNGPLLHEPSSAFVYEVIESYGGEEAFYSTVYIHSVCPLGFTSVDSAGSHKNYNYYDSKELIAAILPVIEWNIREQQRISGSRDVCYCIGRGTNYRFLKELNKAKGFFEKIIPLDHPRFIVQYKQKDKQKYIEEYLRVLR